MPTVFKNHLGRFRTGLVLKTAEGDAKMQRDGPATVARS